MYLLVGLCLVAGLLILAVVTTLRRRKQRVLPAFKAVLITGCDRGFGHMLAKRLDGEGYKVFATCLDDQSAGAQALRQSTSPRLEIIKLDVTKVDDIEAARSTVADLLMGHTLWAIVNNAGIAVHSDFEWQPARSFKLLMEVNFMGVVNVTRAFLPLIRASKGRIVNISSMAGRTALPGFTAYSSSKFAIIGFSDSLRREMNHFGVKVITLEPALYNTDIASETGLLNQNEQFWAEVQNGIKRDYGEDFFGETQKSRSRMLKFASNKVYEVVDSYVDAVTAVHPKSRYVNPTSLRIMNDAMNMTFVWVQDIIIKLIMGVGKKPDMLNPAGNGRLGRRRSHAT